MGNSSRELLEEQIIAFVADNTGVSADRLSTASRLVADIGLAGDDADDLFTAYSERFSVDLAGLDLLAIFGPEGCNPLGLIYCIVYIFKAPPDCRDVTITDLIASAEEGRWTKAPQKEKDAR
jgi:hypothetical protein